MPSLRIQCCVCGDVIGVYEPLVVTGDGCVRRTSLAREPQLAGAKQVGADIEVSDLMRICLSENDRRMAPYDPRLLRPTFVPKLARALVAEIAATVTRPVAMRSSAVARSEGAAP